MSNVSKLASLLSTLAILCFLEKPVAAADPSKDLTDIAFYMMHNLCPDFYYKKISPSKYELSGRPLYLRDPIINSEEKGNWLTAEAFRNELVVFVSTTRPECRMDYFGEHYKFLIRDVKLLLKHYGYGFQVIRDDGTARVEKFSINTKKNWPYSVLLVENKSRSGLAIVATY